MSKQMKNKLQTYGLLLLGSTILSFGIYNIHAQANITEGGVLGAILLIQHWFGISPSIVGFILDITCYAFGFKLLGTSFLRYAITATCGFSLTYRLWESFPPLIPSLEALPLLAAILGGIFVGVGVGIVVRIGGAAGGDDALALIIHKLTKLPIARAYLATDVTVLLLSLTYISFGRIFYSLITVTISSYIIGRIHAKNAQTEAS